MSSRPLVFVAVASSILVGACATGAVATSSGDGDGDGQGNGKSDASTTKSDGGGNPYGGGDGGGKTGDGGLTHTDSGPITPIDSGTTPPPVVDSGTTPPPSTFCTGETSSRENDFSTNYYDDWCDENAEVGVDFSCTSNDDCTGHFTASYEPECCYKPISGGYCQSDYGGGNQCVPK